MWLELRQATLRTVQALVIQNDLNPGSDLKTQDIQDGYLAK